MYNRQFRSWIFQFARFGTDHYSKNKHEIIHDFIPPLIFYTMGEFKLIFRKRKKAYYFLYAFKIIFTNYALNKPE